MYGLKMQAVYGDITLRKPNDRKDMSALLKWDAWNAQKGIDKEAAVDGFNKLAKSTIERKGMDWRSSI